MTVMKHLLALLLCALCAKALAAPLSLVNAASEPVRTALHFRSEPPATSGNLLGPYEILGGVLLLGAAVCWWRLRQPGGALLAGTESLRVMSKCRLSAKSAIYVIRHGEREIMLAESEHGITVIRDDAKL